MKLLFKSRNNHKNKMENEERTSEIKNSFPEKSHKHSTPANEARKSNVKQCTNKPLIKSNKHLLMND